MLEELNNKLLKYINTNYGNIAFIEDDEVNIIRKKEELRLKIASTKNTYLENKCEYGIHLDYENRKDWHGRCSLEEYHNNNIVDDFLAKYGFEKVPPQMTIFDFFGEEVC